MLRPYSGTAYRLAMSESPGMGRRRGRTLKSGVGPFSDLWKPPHRGSDVGAKHRPITGGPPQLIAALTLDGSPDLCRRRSFARPTERYRRPRSRLAEEVTG